METIKDKKDFLQLKNGNQIVGDAPSLENSYISFSGKNNIIYCEKGVVLKDCKIDFNGDNGLLLLGASKNPYSINAKIFNDCSICFGRNNYFNGLLNLVASERCNIVIGDSCLFSFGIWVRTADAHLLYDSQTLIRQNFSKDIIIGDHCWIGQDAMILKNSFVGSGSVVGAKSLVNTKIPSNCSCAGNPARIVRKDVFFSDRSVHYFDENTTEKFAEMLTGEEYIYEADEFNLSELQIPKNNKERLDFFLAIYYDNAQKNRFFVNDENKYAKCNHNYTIVSAVYNVEKYLNDYFVSIVKQSIDFTRHIKIICVDDGSTDNSAEIIKKWQKKYPDNITYLYKENGGQASARNLGLKEVVSEWVTFIDPDDFISKNYFAEIDKQISKDKEIVIVSTNLIFYYEQDKIFKDSHPLKFKFKQTHTTKLADIGLKIQMSASLSIFKTENIQDIVFNENIKPDFEDAKFVGDYLLLNNQDKKICFLKEAEYFYRKRKDESSTLDGAWYKKEKFNDVLKFGKLALLQEAEKIYGKVPVYTQNTVLYDLMWYIQYLLNNSRKVSTLLDKQEQENFLSLIKDCFKFIDNTTVDNFNLAGCWFKHKIGMRGAFKNEEYPFQIVYIENIDREKKQILLSYYYYFEHQDSVAINGRDITPIYQKTVYNEFAGQLFCYEKRYWIPYNDENDVLKVWIAGKSARLSLKGNLQTTKQHRDGVKIGEIISVFKPSIEYAKKDGSWILMDRDTQADDNAEHLYRWIAKNHPEQKIYFALNKNANDWDRLEKEGFNLLEFGTLKFESHLKKCEKIISSHLDVYVNNYFRNEYEYSNKFVWLQHGITKDNQSSWFNSKKNFWIISCASKDEYNYLSTDEYFKTDKKNIQLLGFCRHDELLLNNQQNTKTILIMPTWRTYLLGEASGYGNARKLKDNFASNAYFIAWENLLKSERLKDLVKKYNYKVIFAPHANISANINLFDIPEYIETWSKLEDNFSIQDLFKKTKLMITDYSSVPFELAYLGKGTLYYQFDSDEFFAGHLYGRGYFDYERDGFGPVSYTEDELLSNLEIVLKNNGEVAEKYKKNMDIFPHKDGKCCERTYQAILDLDKPESKEYPDLDILRERLETAINFKAWKLVKLRAELLKQFAETNDETTKLDDLLARCKLILGE